MKKYKNWTRNIWNARPIQNNWFKLNLDTDRDGVKDFKDCRPLNPRLQDEEQTEEKSERLIKGMTKKEYYKEYTKTPKYKEYRQRPDVKKHRAEYSQIYAKEQRRIIRETEGKDVVRISDQDSKWYNAEGRITKIEGDVVFVNIDLVDLHERGIYPEARENVIEKFNVKQLSYIDYTLPYYKKSYKEDRIKEQEKEEEV
jgi:hypothetical protein